MSFIRKWWHRITDRGLFALGLFVGVSATVLLIIVLHSISPTIDPKIQSNSSSREQSQTQKSEKDSLYWPRKLISFEDSIAQWLMMGFTVLAFWVLLSTLKVTREVGKSQTRAYLSRIRGGLWEGIGLEFALDIKNTGNSPAFDVYVIFEMEYQVKGDPIELVLSGGKSPDRTLIAPSYSVRHAYSQRIPIGDIGAGELIENNKSSFLGWFNEYDDNEIEVRAANVGVFGVDVFDEPITLFCGVGWFKDRHEYGKMKEVRLKVAPEMTSGFKLRMTKIFDQKKSRIFKLINE